MQPRSTGVADSADGSRTPKRDKTGRDRDVSEIKVSKLKECNKKSRRSVQMEE